MNRAESFAGLMTGATVHLGGISAQGSPEALADQADDLVAAAAHLLAAASVLLGGSSPDVLRLAVRAADKAGDHLADCGRNTRGRTIPSGERR